MVHECSGHDVIVWQWLACCQSLLGSRQWGGVGVAWRQQEACAHPMKSARSELKVVGKTEEVCFPCRSQPSRRG